MSLGDHRHQRPDRRVPRPPHPRGHGQGQRGAEGEDQAGAQEVRRGVQTDKHAAVAADQVVRALYIFDMVISLKTFTYIVYVGI